MDYGIWVTRACARIMPVNHEKKYFPCLPMDEDVKPKLGTSACPNTSKMTTTGPKSKKSKGHEDLNDVAIAEEATHQKELDLNIQKSKGKASNVQAKIQAKVEMQRW